MPLGLTSCDVCPRNNPRKRPADIAIWLIHKLSSILGFNFTIAGMPKSAASPKNQDQKNTSNLCQKQILKWRGTTRSKLNETNADGTPHIKVLGKDVIEDLLCNGIIRVPATYNPFIPKCAAFSRYVDKVKRSHRYSLADFGRAVGAQAGYKMSRASRQTHVTSIVYLRRCRLVSLPQPPAVRFYAHGLLPICLGGGVRRRLPDTRVRYPHTASAAVISSRRREHLQSA